MFHWLTSPSLFFLNATPVDFILGLSAMCLFLRYNKTGKMVDGLMIALCYVVMIGCIGNDQNFHIHINRISNWVIIPILSLTIILAIIDLEIKRRDNQKVINTPTEIYTQEKIPSWDIVRRNVYFVDKRDEFVVKRTYDFIDYYLHTLKIAHPSFDLLSQEQQQQLINLHTSKEEKL